ncbi:PREDICTED: uncharacterized protein LOC104590857 [Nelumbo nucifera]|nr:PREDICTED: uncharacterized protein LOC104590857 [Nelumbo nucifera]
MASSFNLEKAVCNHGFFMMAPNLWIPSTKTLQRPLRLADSITSVTVRISHPPKHHSIHVLVLDTKALSSPDQQALLRQVARMLRISEEDERKISEFHKIHSKAKKRGFGRLFRSPSLFEDIIKSILLCNCYWQRSLQMATALCELQLELKGGSVDKNAEHASMTQRIGLKRKQATNAVNVVNTTIGDFPSSKELASLNDNFLNDRLKLGYRARQILKLAQGVEAGIIRLEKLEGEEEEAVYKKLMRIEGIGSFTCATILMSIGFYDKIPADTETVSHFQELHGRKDCTIKTVNKYAKEIYGKFSPFQCLAYWFELLQVYEKKVGKLSKLPPSSYYKVNCSIGTSACGSTW